MTRHHGHPALEFGPCQPIETPLGREEGKHTYLDERQEDLGGGLGEELEDEAQGVGCAAPRADEERPEIQAGMSAEDIEDDQGELDGVGPGDGGAGRSDTILHETDGQMAHHPEVAHLSIVRTR